MYNTYATVDEVNTVLADNYVQKKDLPPTVDMDDYRKKDDLSIKNIVDLPIEHKTPDELCDFQGETAFVEFHEGAQLEGYAIVYDGEIDDYVHRDFSITFHTDWNEVGYDSHVYYTTISEVEGFWWNEKTGMFNAGGDVAFAVHLNSAKLYIDDTLALKSENKVLRSKIAELENI